MSLLFKMTLFWDTNIDELDLNKSAPFIIGRILEFGDINDYKMARRLYDEKLISKVAREHNFSRPKDLNFWSLILEIPKENFLCTKKASLQVPRAFLTQ